MWHFYSMCWAGDPVACPTEEMRFTRAAFAMASARKAVRARVGRYKTEAPGSLKALRETGVQARATPKPSDLNGKMPSYISWVLNSWHKYNMVLSI